MLHQTFFILEFFLGVFILKFFCGFETKKKSEMNRAYGYTHEEVTSIEPFFGYTSATSSLRCKHPLNTARHGRAFPGLIQDYTYALTRDWSKLFKKGFIQDRGCEIQITPTDALTFSTIPLPIGHVLSKAQVDFWSAYSASLWS